MKEFLKDLAVKILLSIAGLFTMTAIIFGGLLAISLFPGETKESIDTMYANPSGWDWKSIALFWLVTLMFFGVCGTYTGRHYLNKLKRWWKS